MVGPVTGSRYTGWMPPITPEVAAGQAVDSPFVLRTYDWVVLGFSNRLVWRCPTSEVLRLYDLLVSSRHLDIGVGTGYFLDKAAWPTANPVITLVDLNENSLALEALRIKRYAPQTWCAPTRWEPLSLSLPLPAIGGFDSCGSARNTSSTPGMALHPSKAIVLDHVAAAPRAGARASSAARHQDPSGQQRPLASRPAGG